MVVGDHGADGFAPGYVPGEPPEARVEARVPEQAALPCLEGLVALAEVVCERRGHRVVHGALVGLEPERPDLETVRYLRRRRSTGEEDRHAVDGAPELVAVPAQEFPLRVVRGDAVHLQRRVRVATLYRELGGAPLGEPQQPSAEFGLVELRVDPEVGLQVAGAELVTGVRVADQAVGPFGHPGVAARVETLHGPVVLEVLQRAVGLTDLGDVAGVEEVDDLRSVAPRGGPDAAGRAHAGDVRAPRRLRPAMRPSGGEVVRPRSAFMVLQRCSSSEGRSDRSPAPTETTRRCAG